MAGKANPGTPGKRAPVAVGISDRHQGATHWRTGPERPVVPNGVSGRHSDQTRDTALDGDAGAHAWKQGHRRRRRYGVECNSSSCDFTVSATPGKDAGAIRRMNRRHWYSGVANTVNHALQFLKL